MISGFNKVYTASNGQFIVNKHYTIVLDEINVYEKVAVPCTALKGTGIFKRDENRNPREFANLTEGEKQLIRDYTPEASKFGTAAKVQDIVQLVFIEPGSGKKFDKFFDNKDPKRTEFAFPYYDADFEGATAVAKPSKDFYQFVERVTGQALTGGVPFELGTLFPKGSKYTAYIVADKNGYPVIDRDQVMPFGVMSTPKAVEGDKSGGAVGGAAGNTVDEDAQKFWNLLVSKKEDIQGRPMGIITERLPTWINEGSWPDWTSGFAAWRKLRDLHPEIVVEGKITL